MFKMWLSGILLITFSVLLGACGGNGSDKNSADAVSNLNSAVKTDNSAETDKKSGGQLTVISQKDEGVVLVRSTRFR